MIKSYNFFQKLITIYQYISIVLSLCSLTIIIYSIFEKKVVLLIIFIILMLICSICASLSKYLRFKVYKKIAFHISNSCKSLYKNSNFNYSKIFDQKIDCLLTDDYYFNDLNAYYINGSFITKGFPKYYEAIYHQGTILAIECLNDFCFDFKTTASISNNKTQLLKFNYFYDTIFLSVDNNVLKTKIISNELINNLKEFYLSTANLFKEAQINIYTNKQYLFITLNYKNKNIIDSNIKIDSSNNIKFLTEDDVNIRVSYIKDSINRLLLIKNNYSDVFLKEGEI